MWTDYINCGFGFMHGSHNIDLYITRLYSNGSLEADEPVEGISELALGEVLGETL